MLRYSYSPGWHKNSQILNIGRVEDILVILRQMNLLWRVPAQYGGCDVVDGPNQNFRNFHHRTMDIADAKFLPPHPSPES